MKHGWLRSTFFITSRWFALRFFPLWDFLPLTSLTVHTVAQLNFASSALKRHVNYFTTLSRSCLWSVGLYLTACFEEFGAFSPFPFASPALVYLTWLKGSAYLSLSLTYWWKWNATSIRLHPRCHSTLWQVRVVLWILNNLMLHHPGWLSAVM